MIYYYLLVSFFLLRLSYTDLKEKYVYDIDVLALLAVVISYNVYIDNLSITLWGALAGLISGMIIFGTALFYYGREAFGLGDVFLLTAIGAFYGFPDYYHYFSVCIISTGFLLIPFLSLPASRKMELPLAPVLVLWMGIYSYLDNPTIWEYFRFFMKFFV